MKQTRTVAGNARPRPASAVVTPLVLEQPVLVLSRTYLPVGTIRVREAIVLLVEDKARPVEGVRTFAVRTVRTVFEVPEQIVLTTTAQRTWKPPAPSRREIFRRDDHLCQYCGRRGNTLDHVLPRSRGGPDTWENLVTACEPCNNRKADRTPTEAGMLLRRPPRPPMHPAVIFAEKLWGSGATSA